MKSEYSIFKKEINDKYELLLYISYSYVHENKQDIHIRIKQIFNEYLEFEYPKDQATIKAAVLIDQKQYEIIHNTDLQIK